MKKILVVKGYSEYNVLRRATEEICAGFEKSGYMVETIDATEENAFRHFSQVLEKAEEYAAYFSMQALYWEEENAALPMLQKIRRIGWLVDDPIYHAPRLYESTGTNAQVLLIRDSHAMQLQKDYPKFDSVKTLYHGGFYEENKIPFQEKDLEVFFSGTYLSISDAEKEIARMEGSFGVIAGLTKTKLEELGMNTDWQEALKMCLQAVSFELSEEEFQILCMEMYPLEYYQRAYLRQKMMEALLGNGIEVTVVGRGWDSYQGVGRKKLRILSDRGVDITEVVTLMKRSKIVLNLTNFYDGMHERIFTAMLAGAVCVTNEYSLLNDFFSNGRELVTFSPDRLDKLPKLVTNLLEHPKIAERIADAGYLAAKERHTWQRRGEQIAKWMEDGEDFMY